MRVFDHHGEYVQVASRKDKEYRGHKRGGCGTGFLPLVIINMAIVDLQGWEDSR